MAVIRRFNRRIHGPRPLLVTDQCEDLETGTVTHELHQVSGPSTMIWKFSSAVSIKRQKLLLARRSFDCIINKINQEMKITDFTPESGTRNVVKGCKRAAYRLMVTSEVFDLFYNSADGYRAQYHADAMNGERANRKLLSSMIDALIKFASADMEGNKMSFDEIKHSLKLASAKIWIDEKGSRNQQGSDIKNFRPDLEIEPWITRAKEYVESPGTCPENERAVDGVKAPEGTILEVKGAFITKDGEERIPADKKDRSRHIHEYGFS